MAMEPLPLGFGEFSITMDASLASLWPLLGQDDAHCYPHIESVEEVKQRLAAATVELGAVREVVRRKEQNIAAMVELIRRTAQERDLLRQQHHLLLARELGAAMAMASSSDSGQSPLPSSSSPVAVNRPAMFKPFAVPSPAAVVGKKGRSTTSVLQVPRFAALAGEDKSKGAALDLLAAKRPLPQKGRLVQAMMETGPLLQNLLVAGPLPRWRNPPPVQALTDAMISAPSGSGAQMGLPWPTH